jgi:hypothetical protein
MHWLPPEVTGIVAHQCGRDFSLIKYGLAGRANKNTITQRPSGKLHSGSAAQHPAGTVLLITLPSHQGQLPAPSVSDKFFSISTVPLRGGGTARTTVPKNGYGPFRIEWTHDEKLYTLLCIRGNTSAGKSGVPLKALLKMAASAN